MSRRYFGEEYVAELRSRADIIDLISEYVKLRKSGRRYVGLCPFHQEKTPSFSVDSDKQLFYCFGCGQGGNIFSFLMKIENISFQDAVEQIAKRVGLPLPKEILTPAMQRRRSESQNIRKALDFAQIRYKKMLFSNEGIVALKYLKERGLTRKIIDMFGLGYAPDRWEFIASEGRKAGLKDIYFERSGLIIERERQKGTYYDRFRNRIMFPIWDTQGRIVGFAGRAVGDETPKYLNSPDTPVFHKRKELYALHLAKPSIRNIGTVCVTEGYMDVISMFQNGIDYAVAGMGTALSHEQARALLLLSDDVVLSYDQDEAGKRAVRRCIDVFREAGGSTRVLSLVDAKDPDEFVRNYGGDKFKELIKNATSDIRFIYNEAVKSTDISTVEGKVRVKDIMIPVLASLKSQFESSAYVSEFWRELDVRKESLDRDVELYRQRQQRMAQRSSEYKKIKSSNTTDYDNQLKPHMEKRIGKTNVIAFGRQKAEEGIIRALVENPELMTLANSYLSEKEFADKTCQFIYTSLTRSHDWAQDHEISQQVAEICAKFGPVEQPKRVLMDCVRRIKEFQLRELREKMRLAQEERDEQGLLLIIDEYQELLQQVKSTRGNKVDGSPGDFPRREEG